jgi:hypothetical protein
VNFLTRIAQQLIRTQLHEFQVRRERLPFMRRKRAQQMIAVQVRLKRQHDGLLFYFLRCAPYFLFQPALRSVDASIGIHLEHKAASPVSSPRHHRFT